MRDCWLFRHRGRSGWSIAIGLTEALGRDGYTPALQTRMRVSTQTKATQLLLENSAAPRLQLLRAEYGYPT
jgi:hypothetical protein